MELEAARAPLTRRLRPDPTPGAGEILLQVEACAVCRTDLQICSGDLAAKRLPIVPGHQIVGRVLRLGEGVDPSFRGARLGVGWLASACGECSFCQAGRENLCLRASFTGWDRDGGFASLALVRADFAIPLPEDGDAAAMAPLLCGGVIGYRALRLSGVGPGDRLGLFGFGASALLVGQLALAQGCQLYVVTREPSARERAGEIGATWVGAPGEAPPLPLQGAISFAPVGKVVLEALQSLERGATCVVNAIHLDGIPAFSYRALYWERRLMSVANYSRQDAVDFLRLARETGVRTQFEQFPLTQAEMVLGELQAERVPGAAVLVP
ncbi:MAG: zinc-binding alcohol dehydrogenase family protein [Candidatus Dormibacteria bacterium]